MSDRHVSFDRSVDAGREANRRTSSEIHSHQACRTPWQQERESDDYQGFPVESTTRLQYNTQHQHHNGQQPLSPVLSTNAILSSNRQHNNVGLSMFIPPFEPPASVTGRQETSSMLRNANSGTSVLHVKRKNIRGPKGVNKLQQQGLSDWWAYLLEDDNSPDKALDELKRRLSKGKCM